MNVCVCMCVSEWMYTYTHIYIYIHTYRNSGIMYICMYVGKHTSPYIFMYVLVNEVEHTYAVWKPYLLGVLRKWGTHLKKYIYADFSYHQLPIWHIYYIHTYICLIHACMHAYVCM